MRTLKPRAVVQAQPSQSTYDPFDPFESFIGTPRKRQIVAKRSKKTRETPGMRRKTYIADVEKRIVSQDWTGATPGILVALYWTCHVKVYGIEPTELDTATTWTIAMKAAGKLVSQHFDGDIDTAIKFMRWVWTRERAKEAWARREGVSRSRITWVTQFCKAVYLVNDWRADKVRRRA